MGRAAKCLDALGHADEKVRSDVHTAANNHRLADLLVARRNAFPPGPKSARGALAVDEQFSLFVVNSISFKFSSIVSDVINRADPERSPPDVGRMLRLRPRRTN